MQKHNLRFEKNCNKEKKIYETFQKIYSHSNFRADETIDIITTLSVLFALGDAKGLKLSSNCL